jgi:hypothetical protein
MTTPRAPDGHALPQRVVETLNVIGLTCQFADRFMLRSGNYPLIHHILIGVKRGVLTVRLGNLCPQSFGTPATAVPHVKGNDLATPGIHGNPNPLLIRLCLHEAAHFIRFHLKALNHDVAAAGDRLDMKMIR